MKRLEKIGFAYKSVPTGQCFERTNKKGVIETIFIEDGKVHFYNDTDYRQHIYTKEEIEAIASYMSMSNKDPITRLDWLMQDKDRLTRFIILITSGEYDCQNCPFMDEDGWLYGCNAGHSCTDEDTYDEIDCQLNYEDATDFLAEEMPTEEQMKMWKEIWK